MVINLYLKQKKSIAFNMIMIKTLIYFILSNLFLIEIVSQNILTIDDYKEKEAVYYSNEEFDEWIIESVPLLNSEIYSLQKEGSARQISGKSIK